VAGITHGLVVQAVDLTGEGFAEGAEAAGGVETFVGDAVEGQCALAFAVVDDFAGIAIFVDEAVGGPGEIVVEVVGGKLRQSANAHMDVAQTVELFGQVVGDDLDVAGGKTAMGHESDLCAVGDGAHGLGGFDIFGEVKIVGAGAAGGTGDGTIEIIGQGADDNVAVGDGN